MRSPRKNGRFSPRDNLLSTAEVASLCLRLQPRLALQDALCALAGYALARRTAGVFIVSLDDTDPDPLEAQVTAPIFNGLSWLNLSPDEAHDLGQYGPYIWSARRDLYRDIAMDLVEEDLAYHCFPDRSFAGMESDFLKQAQSSHRVCARLSDDDEIERLSAGEPSVIYMRVPSNHSLATLGLADFPLFTHDGAPMPYFAHVVDNHLMQVTTHVRRRSALEMMPYELLLYQALDWPIPTLLHVPAIHDPQSPDLFEEVGLSATLTEAYSPDALVNYLTHLIWRHPENQLVYPFADFLHGFDIRTDWPETVTMDYQLLNAIQERYTDD